MRVALFALIALLAFASGARAQGNVAPTGRCNDAPVTTDAGTVALCSANIQLTGSCPTGGGQNILATINGGQQPLSAIGGNHIVPWVSTNVTIRGYQIKPFWSCHFTYVEIGNGGGSPDIMGGLSEADLVAGRPVFYPAGTGFAFYGPATLSPPPYLDFHVVAAPGIGFAPNGSQQTYASYNVLLTIFYTQPL